MKEARN